MTPRVSELLTFCVNTYIPTVHIDASMPRGHFDRQDWFEFAPSVEDDCCAYAVLTRMIAAITPDASQSAVLALPALQFHRRSVTTLKERLAKKDCFAKPGTHIAILSLLTAAVYTRNFKEAFFHSKILADIIQNGTVQPGLRECHYIFYREYQRAAMTLTRTCFDYDGWIPQYFAPHWSEFERLLPPELQIDELEKRIDPCIHDPLLRNMLAVLLCSYLVLGLSFRDPKFQTMQTANYARTRFIHVTGRMINYYIDCCESRRIDGWPEDLSSVPHGSEFSQSSSPPRHKIQMPIPVAAFTSLAALCWARTVGRVDNQSIGARKNGVFCAKDLILSKIKELMVAWELHASGQELKDYGPARLFTLYVGAQSEWAKAYAQQRVSPTHTTTTTTTKIVTTESGDRTQITTTTTTVIDVGLKSESSWTSDPGVAVETGRPPSDFAKEKTATTPEGPQGTAAAAATATGNRTENEFFNLRLTSQAHKLGLFTWKQVQDFLEARFLYTDMWPPHGSTWFYRTVAAAEERGQYGVPDIEDQL